MVDKRNLEKFTIEQLQTFKTEILFAETKEELLNTIDDIITRKEFASQTSLNSRFPIDWMNIDLYYRQLLHRNGIDNLAQLNSVKNLWTLEGMSEGAFEQITWAREFFDMTPLENLTPSEKTMDAAVKTIVKKAKGYCRKHQE